MNRKGKGSVEMLCIKHLTLILICILGPARFANADLILDQEFDTGGSGGEAYIHQQLSPILGTFNPVEWAQTFTAGVTGDLSRVDLRVGRNFEVDQPLVMDIRTANGGVPSESNNGSNVLASITIAASSVPLPPVFGFSNFTSFTFSAPAPIVAGNQYAIVLRSDQSSNQPNNFFAYRAITASQSLATYAGGTGYFRTIETWSLPSVSVDLNFRTFVAVPEPSSLLLVAAAIISIKFRCTRRR